MGLYFFDLTIMCMADSPNMFYRCPTNKLGISLTIASMVWWRDDSGGFCKPKTHDPWSIMIMIFSVNMSGVGVYHSTFKHP